MGARWSGRWCYSRSRCHCYFLQLLLLQPAAVNRRRGSAHLQPSRCPGHCRPGACPGPGPAPAA